MATTNKEVEQSPDNFDTQIKTLKSLVEFLSMDIGDNPDFSDVIILLEEKVNGNLRTKIAEPHQARVRGDEQIEDYEEAYWDLKDECERLRNQVYVLWQRIHELHSLNIRLKPEVKYNNCVCTNPRSITIDTGTNMATCEVCGASGPVTLLDVGTCASVNSKKQQS